jgi:hypothetical protein
MKSRLIAITLASVIIPSLSFSAEVKPAKHKSAVEANKDKDKRRAALSKIIEQNQRIMDAYDHQSETRKKNNGVTEEQYEAAKAARNKAQEERNALAN